MNINTESKEKKRKKMYERKKQKKIKRRKMKQSNRNQNKKRNNFSKVFMVAPNSSKTYSTFRREKLGLIA